MAWESGEPTMTRISAAARGLSVLEPLALRLLPDEGLHFEEALPRSWIAELLADAAVGRGPDFACAAEGRVELSIDPLGPVNNLPPLSVRGNLQVPAGTTCVRCLSEMRVEVDATITVTLFADLAKNPKANSGAETPLEDQYDGRVVDLPSIIREWLLLELPVNPTCRDAAACGIRTRTLLEHVNRPAAESAQGLDPRWAALARLRGQDP